MAEKDKNANEEPQAKQRGIVFYISVIGLPLLIIGGAAMFFLMPMLAGEESKEEATEIEETLRPLEKTLTITGLTVNPRNSMGKRFAVFELVLAVENDEVMEVLKKREPILKDRFIEYFRAKTVEELAMDSLMQNRKDDIIAMTNKVAGKKAVYDVFFTRFILQ